MLEKFPCLPREPQLRASDYNLFSESYGNILKNNLPISSRIFFFSECDAFSKTCIKGSSKKKLVSLFQHIQKGELHCGVEEGLILLSFMVEDGCVVGVIGDTEPIFREKVDPNWLFEIARSAEREFLLLKEARVDGQTGLLNLSNLNSLLNASSGEDLGLIIVELVPKRFSYEHVQRHLNKCTLLLKSFVHDVSGLHYLGNCTFCLVLNEASSYGKNEVERSLVAYLRRAGCHRVYVGSSKTNSAERIDENGLQQILLLDEAWTAVCHARKLGPFSFSNYQLLLHPENHPLVPPDRNLVRKLSRLWAGVDKFYLVQFVVESEDEGEYDILLPLLDRGQMIIHKSSIFLFVADGDTQELLQWLRKVVDHGCQAFKGTRIFAGAGYYPQIDFTKSEVVMNCKKALLHASYYQESCVVLFDSVSLNISGDVFFSDGNLTKAVKEYRKGLKCNAQDINLYNSLGVTLAHMDKLLAAYNTFQRALALDPTNFMSFYNLGLVEQKRKNKIDALNYFKRAQQTYNNEDGGPDLLLDLELQLGILSCEEGEYQKAVDYLLNWYERSENVPNSGRIYYYLGRAFSGLKNNRSAMEYLQKALQFDEFDARAMNLLGYIFAKEKQGDDIAISLCLKSVELEAGNVCHRLKLAKVYYLTGHYQEAKENVVKCLRTKNTKVQAQFLLGKIYLAQKKAGRAKAWFEKVQLYTTKAHSLHQEAVKRLQKLSRKI